MLTPEHILPALNTTGQLVPVERIFENHHLDDGELGQLTYLAQYMQGITESFGGAVGLGRDNLPDDMPWLDEWAKQMDSWVDSNGLLLPIPIANEDQGELEIIVQVGVPTPDHMDTYAHMPIGLSIGLQGSRELVGVAFDEIDEVFEAQQKLKRDGKQLADLDDFEGKEVQRIVQGVGDVTQIGGFATLHSGRPLETFQDNGEVLHNAVTIIGYKSMVAAGTELVLQEHMDRYYRAAPDSFANRMSGGNIASSVW